jgi:plasmid maintenance system antidote protein VapI
MPARNRLDPAGQCLGLHGKTGIRLDLALRLEKAGVGTARTWVNLQANYDLWRGMRRKQPCVRALW